MFLKELNKPEAFGLAFSAIKIMDGIMASSLPPDDSKIREIIAELSRLIEIMDALQLVVPAAHAAMALDALKAQTR